LREPIPTPYCYAMPQSLLNIAIIGCGGITLQNHLPGFALCPGVKILAVCDSDEARLSLARSESGASIATTNYADILKREDIHAVVIATPNVTHAPIALEAIGHGKHVLCEKPLAMNSAEAKQMADAANHAGVRHMTAFTYRFVPAMRYLAHLVDRGDLGEPLVRAQSCGIGQAVGGRHRALRAGGDARNDLRFANGSGAWRVGTGAALVLLTDMYHVFERNG